MGFLGDVFDDAKKFLEDPKAKARKKAEKEQDEKVKEEKSTEQQLFKEKILGKFGHYTKSQLSNKFKINSATNSKLHKGKAKTSFCEASKTAKKLGYKYFIYTGDDATGSSDVYYGLALDDDYDLSEINMSAPNSASLYNVYPVFEGPVDCQYIDTSVADQYTHKSLTNMQSQLSARLSKVNEQKRVTDFMVKAYAECANSESKNVEECAQKTYKAEYKDLKQIDSLNAQLKDQNKKLNLLRVANRYEKETNNKLNTTKADNDKHYSTIKSTLTENYNSVSNLNDIILNVSNKLKTNTTIFGMKTNIVKVLTTVAIIMIILAIGFGAYFAYQSIKKHVPFSAQTPSTTPSTPSTISAPSSAPAATIAQNRF